MYAQINYQQKLGSGIYTIHDAGCFITAFCNLLERFGIPIDPPTLNNYLIQHNLYTHDPSEPAGTLDDVYWSTVTSYAGEITTVGLGGAGWPDSNDAIVKFVYTSPRTGYKVTHFCLVADAASHTIVDSYDGVTKVSPYGNPVAWAKYERHQAQPVPKPPAPEALAFTLENIPERTEQLKIDTHLWDLNQRSWPAMVNNPVAGAAANTTFKTTQIAHHVLGGSYYIPEGETSHGYNVVDCDEATAQPPAPAPEPAPVPEPKVWTKNTIDGITFQVIDNSPKRMWISREGGAEKWSLDNVKTWRDFKSVGHLDYGTEVFISGVAHHPIPPKGADYYMTSDDFGDFKKIGQPDNFHGFNWSDLSDTKPPALPEPKPVPVVTAPEPPKPEPVPTQVETPPAASTAPVAWQETWRPFTKAAHYIATRDLIVKDLSGQQPDMPLKHYDAGASDKQGVVSAFGTVTYEGVEYYRLKTNNDPTFSFWYCIPKIDANTRTANLLVMPTTPMPAPSKINVARDGLELARAKIENDVPKFLDDIIPKWLHKNKK